MSGIRIISSFFSSNVITESNQIPFKDQGSSSPYGINAHRLPLSALSLAKEAGIEWVRIDINWKKIEGRDEYGNKVYNWANDGTDAVINNAASLGLNILANLGNIDGVPDYYNGGTLNYFPSAHILDWQEYLTALATRYSGIIKYWGVWNEPDLDKFWAGTDNEYVNNILIPAHQAIKAVDSSAKICGPDYYNYQTASGLVNWLFTNYGQYIDVITFHQYDGNDIASKRIELIEGYHEAIVALGYGHLPFWITETGWNTDRFGEITQALSLAEIMQSTIEKPWWDKTFWFDLRDDPRYGVEKWGILKDTDELKIAWCTYRDHIKRIPVTPDLLSPSDNIYIQTNTPTLEWYRVDCGQAPYVGYEITAIDFFVLQVLEGSSIVFQEYVYPEFGLEETYSVEVPYGYLLDGHSYSWKVRAHNENDLFGEWSETRIFTIGYIPGTPSLVSPKGNITVSSLKPTFIWNAVNVAPPVDNYRLQIKRCSDAAIILDKWVGTLTSYGLSFHLESNVRYKWRVRAHNDVDWGNWSGFAYFWTPAELPGKVYLQSPTNNSTTASLRPRFYWHAVSANPAVDATAPQNLNHLEC